MNAIDIQEEAIWLLIEEGWPKRALFSCHGSKGRKNGGLLKVTRMGRKETYAGGEV